MADYRSKQDLAALMNNGAWDDKYANITEDSFGGSPVQQTNGQDETKKPKVIKVMDGMRDASNQWQWSGKEKKWVPAETTAKSAATQAAAGAASSAYGMLNLPQSLANSLASPKDSENNIVGNSLRTASSINPILALMRMGRDVPMPDAVKATIAQAPATTAEKYIRAGSEGATGGAVMGPFGVLGGTAGGLTGELADQTYNENGKLGIWPRLLGNVVGGSVTAAPSAIKSVGSFRNQALQATRGMSNADWADALSKQNAAKANGVDITIAEASNNPALLQKQRLVENHPETMFDARDYMAARTDQMKGALSGQNRSMVPGPRQDPRLTGVAIQNAAEKAISDARGFASAQSTPSFNAARDFGNIPANPEIANNPLFQDAISAIANDPKYGMVTGKQPYSQPFLGESAPYASVQNANPSTKATQWNMDRLIAASKYLKEQADAYGNPISPSASATAAENYGGLNRKLRSYMADQVPDYAIGNRLYSRAAGAQLDPRQNSLVGEIASQSAPEVQMGSALNPQRSISKVVTAAAKDLKVRDPSAYQQWIKNHITSEIDDAFRPLSGNAEEFAGARFARQLGDKQKQANLKALVEELPAGKSKWIGFQNLVKTLELTGNRLPTGSATSFNNLALDEMTTTGLARSAAKLGSDPIGLLRDKFQSWAIRSSAKDWRDVLFSQDGGAALRKMAMAKPGSDAMYTLIGGMLANRGLKEIPDMSYEDMIGATQ